MLDEQTTPAAEENEPEETVNDDTQEEEETEEETIGDSIDDKPEPDQIPKARLDKEINRRKELEKKLAEAESKSETTSNDSDLEARLAKIEAEDKMKKLNETLDTNIAKALEEAPEFKDIINVDVIKQMALNPANQSKTYLQLLEDAYGNALGGKRTTETTTPRGGTNDGKVDIAKAKSDKEYFKQVMDSPELKKQYNEALLSESV